MPPRDMSFIAHPPNNGMWPLSCPYPASSIHPATWTFRKRSEILFNTRQAGRQFITIIKFITIPFPYEAPLA